MLFQEFSDKRKPLADALIYCVGSGINRNHSYSLLKNPLLCSYNATAKRSARHVRADAGTYWAEKFTRETCGRTKSLGSLFFISFYPCQYLIRTSPPDQHLLLQTRQFLDSHLELKSGFELPVLQPPHQLYRPLVSGIPRTFLTFVMLGYPAL